MNRRRCLALGAVLAVTGCATDPADAPHGAAQRGQVVYVTDGDTLKVRLGDGTIEDVRLLGIDTPETKKPGVAVECGGHDATAALEALASGRSVTLRGDTTQQERDRYGRLLAYVTVKSGPDLSEAQIRAGWSDADRRWPLLRTPRYLAAAAEARRDGRGAWTLCDGDFHRPETG
jgi:micrococcal nuclease